MQDIATTTSSPEGEMKVRIKILCSPFTTAHDSTNECTTTTEPDKDPSDEEYVATKKGRRLISLMSFPWTSLVQTQSMTFL